MEVVEKGSSTVRMDHLREKGRDRMESAVAEVLFSTL